MYSFWCLYQFPPSWWNCGKCNSRGERGLRRAVASTTGLSTTHHTCPSRDQGGWLSSVEAPATSSPQFLVPGCWTLGWWLNYCFLESQSNIERCVVGLDSELTSTFSLFLTSLSNHVLLSTHSSSSWFFLDEIVLNAVENCSQIDFQNNVLVHHNLKSIWDFSCFLSYIELERWNCYTCPCKIALCNIADI